MELKRRMGIEQLEISGGRRKRGERESNGKIKIESGRKETKERGTKKCGAHMSDKENRRKKRAAQMKRDRIGEPKKSSERAAQIT